MTLTFQAYYHVQFLFAVYNNVNEKTVNVYIIRWICPSFLLYRNVLISCIQYLMYPWLITMSRLEDIGQYIRS